MNRKNLSMLFVLSTVTVITAVVVLSLMPPSGLRWPLVELGPAVIQDSYLHGAPALESPFGMIGDNPGGYPLYSGSPLDGCTRGSLSEWMNVGWSGQFGVLSMNLIPFTIALTMFIIPILLIVSLGRQSYGASKTR